MRGRKKSGGWLSQLGMVGMGAVILTAALFVIGIFAWMYLFSVGESVSAKALTVEAIVYGLIFVLSMIGILSQDMKTIR